MNKIHTEFLHGIIHETIPECESVDGYFKGKNDIFHLLGNNDIAISNEMNRVSTLYNMIHLVRT